MPTPNDDLKGQKPGFQLDDGDDKNLDNKDASKGDKDVDKDKLDAGADKDKGEKLYTKEDVSRMIQGRLSDDKYRKIVERIAKNAGISADEVEAQLDNVEREMSTRQIKQQAKELNMDPRVLTALAHMSAQLESNELKLQIKDMEGNKKDYPDFAEFKDKVIDKAKQKGLTLDEAYWIVAGASRTKQSAREAEHRLENNRQKQHGKDRVQGDDSSQFGTSGDKIPDDVVAMARKVGEDPQDYYDSMMSGDIDQWRERKARRNKK